MQDGCEQVCVVEMEAKHQCRKLQSSQTVVRKLIDQTELLSNARTVLRRSIESSVHRSVVQTTLSNACN